MSELTVQSVLGIRYRTSADADRITMGLMQNLGLSTKANVARLAIGRSLSLGEFSSEEVDAKGMEIPAASLFSPDDTPIWIGLVVTHARSHNRPLTTLEEFRSAIRKHWHRGVAALQQDWNDCGQNYDRFIEILISRRASLPIDTPHSSDAAADSNGSHVQQSGKPADLCDQIERKLKDLGFSVQVRGVQHGPRISSYKLFLQDVNQHGKLKRSLESLQIALSLSSTPSLHKADEASTMWLDVARPEESWERVPFEGLLNWASTQSGKDASLPVYIGVDSLGKPYSFDLATAPHLLVAGTTGSGKSICLHSLILSLIHKCPSSKLQLALIDPKQVEFSAYRNLPHLYGGAVTTDASSAVDMLTDLVEEMDRRYSLFSASGVSSISEARRKGNELPYIVIFVEELADLLIQAKRAEDLIVRLAQKARAAGIHLVLATQRPDAKTISGLIRSNIPARIALTVQKGTESTIILDDGGAENLLGKGDMIAKVFPGSTGDRVHGVWVSREDIDKVVKESSRNR